MATTINLQPDTITDEEHFAGNGTLGPFTFRQLRADITTPQPSSTCSGPNQFNFPVAAGAGVFRFQHGSLLKVRITEGAVCVDLTARGGPPYRDLSDHRWNRAFQGCVRRPYVEVDVDARCCSTPLTRAKLLTNTGEI